MTTMSHVRSLRYGAAPLKHPSGEIGRLRLRGAQRVVVADAIHVIPVPLIEAVPTPSVCSDDETPVVRRPLLVAQVVLRRQPPRRLLRAACVTVSTTKCSVRHVSALAFASEPFVVTRGLEVAASQNAPIRAFGRKQCGPLTLVGRSCPTFGRSVLLTELHVRARNDPARTSIPSAKRLPFHGEILPPGVAAVECPLLGSA